MSQPCPECRGITTWDDSVGSSVCTSCGTLTDPSQSVLTSHFDYFEEPVRYRTGWDLSSTRRTRFSSWTLAERGKEARDKRNSAAILEFIESLARSLNSPGLSPRAMNLFCRAKDSIQFRWGQKAKLVAGACLAVALRESKRPDCTRDISYLMDQPFSAVSRTFTSITKALDLSLVPTDAISYIPMLHQHTASLLNDRTSSLPAALIEDLSVISLQAVASSAGTLSGILARAGTPSVAQRPMQPIACAIFILSLEAELRSTIKRIIPLAQALGARLSIGKGAVMASYKKVQDAIASLTEKVPWLDTYRSKNGRAKVAKRTVVVRAIKDVITFYNDTWKATEKPSLDIIYDEEEDKDNHFPNQEMSNVDEESHLPRKKRKTQHAAAIDFLLDPVAAPLPVTTATHSTPQPSLDHSVAYYLSTSSMASQNSTRLQMLAATRGGADQIADSELFEEGEMEGFMRDEEEMKVMAHMLNWKEGEEFSGAEPSIKRRSRTSSKLDLVQQNHAKPEEHRPRIDPHVLARILNDEEPFNGLLNSGYASSVDMYDISDVENQTPPLAIPRPSTPQISTEELIIEGWRPTSPEHNATNDWYDEAYDE